MTITYIPLYKFDEIDTELIHVDPKSNVHQMMVKVREHRDGILQQALTMNDRDAWNKYLVLQQGHRILLELYDRYNNRELPLEILWEHLGSALIRSDDLWQYKESLEFVRNILLLSNESLMLNEELEKFEELPDPIHVHQGCYHLTDGFSWTTSYKVAHKFAIRHTIRLGNMAERFSLRQDYLYPCVLTGKAYKKDVTAYFTRRGEYEVFIDPLKVKNIETKQILAD